MTILPPPGEALTLHVPCYEDDEAARWSEAMGELNASQGTGLGPARDEDADTWRPAAA